MREEWICMVHFVGEVELWIILFSIIRYTMRLEVDFTISLGVAHALYQYFLVIRMTIILNFTLEKQSIFVSNRSLIKLTLILHNLNLS